jgi:hypothetical protein
VCGPDAWRFGRHDLVQRDAWCVLRGGYCGGFFCGCVSGFGACAGMTVQSTKDKVPSTKAMDSRLRGNDKGRGNDNAGTRDGRLIYLRQVSFDNSSLRFTIAKPVALSLIP